MPTSNKKKQGGINTNPAMAGGKSAAANKSSVGESGPAGSGDNPAVSFLFVVHEYPPRSPRDCERDDWGFLCPPTNREMYQSVLFESRVMRYLNGEISDVSDRYRWVGRNQNGERVGGTLSQIGGGGMLEPYKTATVFSCGHPLPIVAVPCDASLEDTARFRPDPHNPQQNAVEADLTWSLLQFWHPGEMDRNMTGMSQVTTRQGHFTSDPRYVRPYAAGTGSLWVHGNSGSSLAPAFFQSPFPHAGTSRGLGGELPLLIGLMAFHCRHRVAGEATDLMTPMFVGTQHARAIWSNHIWYGTGPPQGLVQDNRAEHRGFLVQVFYDSYENPNGSRADLLGRLEWHSVLVSEELPQPQQEQQQQVQQ